MFTFRQPRMVPSPRVDVSRGVRRWSVLLPAALLAACSLLAPKLERPDLSLVGIEIRGGNFLQQNLLLTLHIHNPNARTLPVHALHADLKVGGEVIASGVSSAPFVVPAEGDANCEILVTANMALGLLKLSHPDKRTGAIEYDLDGVAEVDLPLRRSLPFHQHGSYPLRAGGG